MRKYSAVQKLDQLLKVASSDQRLQGLTDLARSLHVNVAKAENKKGDLKENTLAVMIHDAIQEQRRKKQQMIALVGIGVVLLLLGVAVMLAMSQSAANLRSIF